MKALKGLQDLPLHISLFLLLAAVVTLVFGLVFVAGQQIYRQSANDPQVQISEDMAAYAAEGKDINSILPKEVDISKSLVWFVMFFDDSGNVIASNAKIDGQAPVLPNGVLEHVKNNGQNRVTWQPKEGVRIASVITKYDGGSVLVGRSLRETENRIMSLGKKVFGAWIISIALIYVGSLLLLSNHKRSH